MPVRCRMRFSVAAIALPCLMTGVVLAQQETQQDTQRQSSAPGRDVAGQSGARQSDRTSTQQGGQNSTQVSPRTHQSGQQHTANFRGAASTGEKSQGIEQYVANCLLIKNQMEIELSQFASQQSQNPEVKEFAQQMVQDHQKMVQQLQQIAGAQNDGGSSSLGQNNQSGGADGSTSPNSTNRLDSASGLRAGEASGISGSGGGSDRPGDGATAARGNNSNQSSATGQSRSLPGSSGTNTQPQTSATTSSAREGTAVESLGSASSSNGAIQQLIQMNRQIAARQGQAAREDLQQKSGAEFDKCFVGTAIVKHTDMVAELEVIEQQAQGRLAQLAQQARPVAQQHLDHAKQLMTQLEGQSSAGAPNGRNPRQATRTER